MRFEVRDTKGGEPSWWLYSGNGQMVAWAGESFASASNAKRSAKAFKAGAEAARYDIYQDAGGHWRWRAWRSSAKVATSGESFASQSNAERAAHNVRDHASGAEGP